MGSAEDADRTGMPPRIDARRRRRKQADAIRRDVLRINLLSERLLDKLHAAQEATPQRKTAPPAPADPLPTAHNLSLERTPNGGAVVSIDGKRANLTPALAALVAILTSDEGLSADEFVDFKSFDLVRERLGDRLGRSFRRHNAAQLLYRLRKTKGLDARLIEISKEKGVRLRLKRYAATAIAQ